MNSRDTLSSCVLARKELVFITIVSLTFGFSFTLPKLVDGAWGAGHCVAIAVLIAIAQTLLFFALALLVRKSAKKGKHVKLRRGLSPRAVLFGSFIILWAATILALLSSYAGYFGTDSRDIVEQAAGRYAYSDHWRYEGLSNHHPILYTMLFRLVLTVTAPIGGETTALFVFMLLQSGICSLLLAYALSSMAKHGASNCVILIALLLLAIVPVYAAHEITMFKDALFSSALLATAFKLHGVCYEGEHGLKDLVVLFALSLLVSFMRNNGVYVMACALAYVAIVAKEVRIPSASCLAGLLAVVLIVQGPVFTALNIEKSHFSESAGIMLQQIARIEMDDGIDREQADFLGRIIPIEEMEGGYLESSVNKIKFNPKFDDAFLESHKPEFFQLWAQLVLAHPNTAAKAWIIHTEDIWRPGSYAKIVTSNTIGGGAPQDLIGLSYSPRDAFDKLEAKLPYIFGKGSAIWIMVWLPLFAVVLLKKNRARFLAAFIPGMALFATMMIATPSSWDYRYIYYYTLFIPFMPFFLQEAYRSWKTADKAPVQIQSGQHSDT